jgi:hypothetical protein
MIYLSPMVYLFPGVDTWWEWFERNFNPTSHNLPETYNSDDLVFRYSTKGAINAYPGKSIAMCWELLPELKRVLNTNAWDVPIQATYEAAKSCTHRIITTEFARTDYERFGKVDFIPIGIDTDFFKPCSLEEKYNLKLKYAIPEDKSIGFWCGTTHPMKGYQYVLPYAKEHPEIYWIIVWYTDVGHFTGYGQEHVGTPQSKLVELMNCADFQLETSILRPYYMIEYEGMACNLKRRKILNIQKDFEVGDNPRDVIFEKQWDRITCKKLYENYINNL